MPDTLAVWLRRLNDWAERHPRLLRAADGVWNVYIALFAVLGAAIAGWALAQGVAGVLFAIPVAIGAWMVLRYGQAGSDE